MYYGLSQLQSPSAVIIWIISWNSIDRSSSQLSLFEMAIILLCPCPHALVLSMDQTLKKHYLNLKCEQQPLSRNVLCFPPYRSPREDVHDHFTLEEDSMTTHLQPPIKHQRAPHSGASELAHITSSISLHLCRTLQKPNPAHF